MIIPYSSPIDGEISVDPSSIIYIGSTPLASPATYYLDALHEQGHQVILGPNFQSGLELVNGVRRAALWVIEVMMSVEGADPQIAERTSHGLGAGLYLSQLVLQQTTSPILLLGMPQPCSPALLNTLETSLGDRGFTESAYDLTPVNFALMVDRLLLEGKASNT